ncbi:hypothetical protein D3C77_446060 [compost metagenome]
MPQRHVLVSGHHMPADDAGQTGNILAADWVALVRHGGGAFLAFSEGLLDLSELALLQGTDFGSEFIERCGD